MDGSSLIWRKLAGAATGTLDDSQIQFEALVDDHYKRTYLFIYRMLASETEAADLTQETFIRAYRALPRLREQVAAGAWIRRIATNLCLDYIRRRRNTPYHTSIDAPLGAAEDGTQYLELQDSSSDPDILFQTAESNRMLKRAVENLAPDYRVVIVLHHMEDWRVEQIADLLGVPVGTIKSRLSRARKELRRRLGPWFRPGAAG